MLGWEGNMLPEVEYQDKTSIAIFSTFSLTFLLKSLGIKKLFVNLHLQSERSAKTYCSIDSQSPPREMSKHIILDLSL